MYPLNVKSTPAPWSIKNERSRYFFQESFAHFASLAPSIGQVWTKMEQFIYYYLYLTESFALPKYDKNKENYYLFSLFECSLFSLFSAEEKTREQKKELMCKIMSL